MDLLKKGHVQYVVISGYIKQGTVQALTMAKWLQEHSPLTGQAQIHFHDGSLQQLDDLDSSRISSNNNRIIFETSSNNTWQNALCSLRIAEQRQWSKVVVVTSSYHQLRSSLVFQQQQQQEQQEQEEAKHHHHHLSAYGGVHAPVDTHHSGSMRQPVEVLMARAPEQEYVERWRGQKDFARELAAVALYVWRGRIPPTVAVKAMLPLSVPYLVFLISGAIAAHQLLRLHNSKTNHCQQNKSNQAEPRIAPSSDHDSTRKSSKSKQKHAKLNKVHASYVYYISSLPPACKKNN